LIFHAENGELVVRASDGTLHWHGQPENRPVEWATSIPGSTEGIALYHYYRPDHPYGPFENLVRLRPDSSIVWHAELPESDDKYVTAYLHDGRLFARSWSCYEAEIDLATGRIIRKVFTK
jgi:hypothetical protein